MPTRKIFAATHTRAKVPATNITADSNICHIGGSYGMRTIITTGDVNGMNDVQRARGPLGLLAE